MDDQWEKAWDTYTLDDLCEWMEEAGDDVSTWPLLAGVRRLRQIERWYRMTSYWPEKDGLRDILYGEED